MLYGLEADNAVTEHVIGCAIEVHRELGPGLLESVYEEVLCIELKACEVSFKRQVGVPLHYKGQLISEHRPDLVVADRLRGPSSGKIAAQPVGLTGARRSRFRVSANRSIASASPASS